MHICTAQTILTLKTATFYESLKWWKVEIKEPSPSQRVSVKCNYWRKTWTSISQKTHQVLWRIIEKCIFFSLNSVSHQEKGYFLHSIPFWGKIDQDEKKTKPKKGVDFRRRPLLSFTEGKRQVSLRVLELYNQVCARTHLICVEGIYNFLGNFCPRATPCRFRFWVS